jgi:hypothetical protein
VLYYGRDVTIAEVERSTEGRRRKPIVCPTSGAVANVETQGVHMIVNAARKECVRRGATDACGRIATGLALKWRVPNFSRTIFFHGHVDPGARYSI